MAKFPETLLKEKFLPALRVHGWFIKLQLVALLGIPDIIGICKGRFVAIELKRAAGLKPSALQTYHLVAIEKHGGTSMSVNPSNYKEAIEVIAYQKWTKIPLDMRPWIKPLLGYRKCSRSKNQAPRK